MSDLSRIIGLYLSKRHIDEVGDWILRVWLLTKAISEGSVKEWKRLIMRIWSVLDLMMASWRIENTYDSKSDLPLDNDFDTKERQALFFQSSNVNHLLLFQKISELDMKAFNWYTLSYNRWD